jgi:hypothetical protein
VSRFSFVLLDLTTLIDTTLDRKRYSAFVRSAPVAALRQCALLLLETLDRNLPTAKHAPRDVAEARDDQESYAAAVETLQRAGIETRSDAASYADQRSRWEPLIHRIAPMFGYGMDEIECCRRVNRPASTPRAGGQEVPEDRFL